MSTIMYHYMRGVPLQWYSLVGYFDTLPVDDLKLQLLTQLQVATKSLQEVMKGIQDDPSSLSLLEKRKWQKGFRDLQGDKLSTVLKDVIQILVSNNTELRYIYIQVYTCCIV